MRSRHLIGCRCPLKQSVWSQGRSSRRTGHQPKGKGIGWDVRIPRDRSQPQRTAHRGHPVGDGIQNRGGIHRHHSHGERGHGRLGWSSGIGGPDVDFVTAGNLLTRHLPRKIASGADLRTHGCPGIERELHPLNGPICIRGHRGSRHPFPLPCNAVRQHVNHRSIIGSHGCLHGDRRD